MPKEQLTIIEKNPNIVTMGGGNGSPTIHKALFATGEVDFINAIATPFDSGGATGKRREDSRGEEPAYSDAMRILLSLATPNGTPQSLRVMERWFNHRDERNTVLGQEIFNRFYSKKRGYAQIEEDMRDLGIHVRGTVLPASTEPSNIAFVTASGREFKGEHELDDQRMSPDPVMEMYLAPSVPAFGPALDAVEQAKLIVLSTGSLHGSVLANTLPEGMKHALSKSKAQLYMVTNLLSNRNETHGYTPLDFAEVVEKYAGRRPDGFIVPEMTQRQFENRHPRAAGLYNLEYSSFLGWEDEVLERTQAEGINIITHQATKIVHKSYNDQPVRHDPEKLAEALQKIPLLWQRRNEKNIADTEGI